ncbi:MAG: hypothetical protein ACREJ0_06925 [Geminicoccaceae bacterium]
MCVGLATRAAAGEVALEVGETIVLEAEGATLREAVLAISEAVPLTLVERGAAPEEPVSLTVEANTWQGFFRRLLGSESHLLTLDRATGKPTQLVVRWDAVRELQAAAPEGGAAGDVESRIRAAAGEVLAPRDLAGEAIAAMEDARDAFEAARGGPNEAEAREAYLDAIDGLNTHDEARTVEALVPALAIDDRDARLAGLETLRELSHTARTPAAVDAAISAIETADDDTVERAAIDVLTRYGDQKEVMRLLEPLALSDGPNRDIAVREWIRIRDEQIAREKAARAGDPQLRAGQ